MGLLTATAVIAPEMPAQSKTTAGWASAYAPGVMTEVIRFRLDNDLWRVPPAQDWYTAHGAVATNDCDQVGKMLVLVDPAGRERRVLVADCGGDDGGSAWMTANNIVAELDASLWQRLTDEFGRPLAIELREE